MLCVVEIQESARGEAANGERTIKIEKPMEYPVWLKWSQIAHCGPPQPLKPPIPRSHIEARLLIMADFLAETQSAC